MWLCVYCVLYQCVHVVLYALHVACFLFSDKGIPAVMKSIIEVEQIDTSQPGSVYLAMDTR